MKKILIFSIILLFLVGCSPAPGCPTCEICQQCEPTIEYIYVNNTIEKIINNTIIIEKQCNNSNLDLYNATLPYVLKIKRLDRQLNECLERNLSCYNESKARDCEKCEYELNYTKYMFDEWNIMVGEK